MNSETLRSESTNNFTPLLAISPEQMAELLTTQTENTPSPPGGYSTFLEAIRAGRLTAVATLPGAPSRHAGGETWVRLVGNGDNSAMKKTTGSDSLLLPKTLFLSQDTPLPQTLPQIALKNGIETLLIPSSANSSAQTEVVSSSPSAEATFPHQAFWWQGIDGSRILVLLLPPSLSITVVRYSQDMERLLSSPLQPAAPPAGKSIGDLIASARSTATLPVWAAELSGGSGSPHAPTVGEKSRRDRLFTMAAQFGMPKKTDSEEIGAALAEQINTRGMRRPVLMVSNLSHYANEAITVPISERENPAAAVGPEGDSILVQVLEENGRRLALFVPRNLPLHGYSVWDMATTLTPPSDADTVSVSETHIENDSLLAEFDAETGLLTRLYDKDGDRELMEPAFMLAGPKKTPKLIRERCGNRLEFSRTTATDLAGAEKEAPSKSLDLSDWDRVEAAEIVENGPVRGAIRFQRRFGNSVVVQTVRLTAGSARLDFVMEIYGRPVDDEGSSTQGGANVQIVFPVAINGLQGTYSAPYGVVKRHGHLNTRWEADLLQNSGGNWVDLSEGDYGVALMHTGGAAVAALDNCLCIEIAEGTTPSSEEQIAEAGTRLSNTEEFTEDSRSSHQRRLTFALFPHPGDYREGEVIEQAEALFLPPKARTLTGNQPGALPMERSFFSVDNAAVTLEVADIQPDAVFVRLIEWHNTRGEVILTTALPVRKAFLTDLRYQVLQELPVSGNEIVCAIRPFEILTLKLTR